MKKVSFIAFIATMTSISAFADIDANNNDPTCDSTTIGATSGDTALDAVWNIVNQTCSAGQYFDMTTATCVTCTANSYCPGGTYNVESQSNGLNSCPNGYGLSASGAGAQTDCYRTCTTNDVAHSETVSGGYYYGDNNQCSPTSCVAGYTTVDSSVDFKNLDYDSMTMTNLASINNDGTFGEISTSNQEDKGQTYYGITTNGEWAADFSDFGTVRGTGICSTTSGHYNNGSPDVLSYVTNDTGNDNAQYCWCNLTGFRASGESNWENLTSSWIAYDAFGSATDCSRHCDSYCPYYLGAMAVYRSAMFGAVAPSLASCEANTINITWYNEGNVHDENTCTYAESVTLPETNPQRTGYNFTGWTVRPASTPASTPATTE